MSKSDPDRDEPGDYGCFGIAVGMVAAAFLWGFLALLLWLRWRNG